MVRARCAHGHRVVGLPAGLAACSPPRAPAAARRRRDAPQVSVGGFPPGSCSTATHTIYVGNGTSAEMSLIDGRTCNARSARGCRHQHTAVTGGVDPVGIDRRVERHGLRRERVRHARDRERAPLPGRQRLGLQGQPVTVPLGVRPQFLAVDARHITIYVANVGSNTISVIDGRRCNAQTTAGCHRPRPISDRAPALHVGAERGDESLYVTRELTHRLDLRPATARRPSCAAASGRRSRSTARRRAASRSTGAPTRSTSPARSRTTSRSSTARAATPT